jgi:hypothetical protein
VLIGIQLNCTIAVERSGLCLDSEFNMNLVTRAAVASIFDLSLFENGIVKLIDRKVRFNFFIASSKGGNYVY